MRVALITGVSGAIGKAIALEFLKNGYFVIGQYNSNAKKIEEFKNEIADSEYSDYFFAVQADFSKESEVQKLYETVSKSFKHIDVLVNNAGKDLYKLVTETENCEWDEIFNVNVKSAFILTKNFAREMISRSSGKIVFVSSIWGNNGGSMESAYSASKSALIGFTKALAKELSPSNINVNCVCPGVIDTPMNDRFSKEEKLELEERTPLKRMGTPSEIADIIYFLSSEKSDFITGQVITVDGGFTL